MPVAQCQRLFTPAGEELWVDGGRPNDVMPSDGRTERGMVFTTGAGDGFTIWTLADFDTDAHYARYVRVTPASRCGFVEVRCAAIDERRTGVTVGYELTALAAQAEHALDAFEGSAFTAMIEGWRAAIAARLPQLRVAGIR